MALPMEPVMPDNVNEKLECIDAGSTVLKLAPRALPSSASGAVPPQVLAG